MHMLARIDFRGGCTDRPAEFEDGFVDINLADCDLVTRGNRIAEFDRAFADRDCFACGKVLEGYDDCVAKMQVNDF